MSVPDIAFSTASIRDDRSGHRVGYATSVPDTQDRTSHRERYVTTGQWVGDTTFGRSVLHSAKRDTIGQYHMLHSVIRSVSTAYRIPHTGRCIASAQAGSPVRYVSTGLSTTTNE
eukprot:3338324-Rhodomonas_salina.1